MDKRNHTVCIQYAAYIHDQIKKIVPHLISQKCKILDFGCGDGFLTHCIQNTFYKAQVLGIDSDTQIVKQAQLHFPHLAFMQVNETRLPFDDESFDLIYGVDVLHHIKRSDHALYSAELMRLLKPGGTSLFFEINPYNLFSYCRFKKNPLEKNNRLLKPSYASQLFNKNNYTVILKYYYVSNFLPDWLQEYMYHIPFGSVYSVQVHKN